MATNPNFLNPTANIVSSSTSAPTGGGFLSSLGGIAGVASGLGTVSAIAGNLGSITSVLSSVGLGDIGGFLGSTIGAVFSGGGINLACWGTSRPVDVAKKDTALDMEDILNGSGIKTSLTQNSFNEFMRYCNGYISRMTTRMNTVSNPCTKDGYALSINTAKKLRDDMINAVGQAHNLSEASIITVQPNGWKMYATAGKKDIFNWDAYTYQSYTLSAKSGGSTNQSSDGLDTDNNDNNSDSGFSLLKTIAIGLGINFISKQF